MTELLMREAIKKGLEEALEQDPNVLIMGEDIGAYGGAYLISNFYIYHHSFLEWQDLHLILQIPLILQQFYQLHP